MANVLVTEIVMAKWAADAFLKAMGKQRLAYRDEITEGVLYLHVPVMPTDDPDEMRRRIVRAGRALADEAKRKRLRAVMPQDAPRSDYPAAQAMDRERGVAVRVWPSYSIQYDRTLIHVDMRGSRRAVPVCA